MIVHRRNHPGVAAVLSFVFNGLGQLYNGQIAKGLWIIFLSAISTFIFIIGIILIGFWIFGKIMFLNHLFLGIILSLLGIVLLCVLGIYSILDAYNFASQK